MTTARNLKESVDFLLTSDTLGYTALLKAAAKGALLGLGISPSYLYISSLKGTLFNELRQNHMFQNNQLGYIKLVLKSVGRPMGIGAAIGVAYTFFFRNLWSTIPYSEEYTYPIGLGIFGSGLAFSFGSPGVIRAFTLGWIIGMLTRNFCNVC